MNTPLAQDLYQTVLQTSEGRVKTSKSKMESQLNATLSAYKTSQSKGEAAVKKYVEYENDYKSELSAQYYIKNYLSILLQSVKDFGEVNRFDSEWNSVYERINSDLKSATREKISLERKIMEICLVGGTASTGQMNDLSRLSDEIQFISGCKVFHEILWDLAFNYNSQIPKHCVGDTISSSDVGGTSYSSCTVIQIVTKDELPTACPEVTLDSVLSTLPEEYKNPNPDFTMFYILQEPITYSDPVEDPETGVVTPGTANPAVYHIAWDEMLYGK